MSQKVHLTIGFIYGVWRDLCGLLGWLTDVTSLRRRDEGSGGQRHHISICLSPLVDVAGKVTLTEYWEKTDSKKLLTKHNSLFGLLLLVCMLFSYFNVTKLYLNDRIWIDKYCWT